MIEAPEFITPTQRELHNRYVDIHRRFFPSAPPYRAKPVTAPPIAVQEPPHPITQPTKAIPLESTNTRLKMIRAAVCEFYNVTEEDIKSQRRSRDVLVPRHMVCHLAAKLTKASLPLVGRMLGGRDHTTILHAIRQMKIHVRNNRLIWQQATRLETRLRQQFGDTSTPRNCIGRYVVHERVLDYFKLGWMWAANLNEYAALMVWVCGCECVEPKDG